MKNLMLSLMIISCFSAWAKVQPDVYNLNIKNDTDLPLNGSITYLQKHSKSSTEMRSSYFTDNVIKVDVKPQENKNYSVSLLKKVDLDLNGNKMQTIFKQSLFKPGIKSATIEVTNLNNQVQAKVK